MTTAERRPAAPRGQSLKSRSDALADVLPFFRLCPEAAMVATILRETAELSDDEFRARCRRVIREGDHGGNVVREILKA